MTWPPASPGTSPSSLRPNSYSAATPIFADRARYNKALTERRVQRAKAFLIEHGVPAGSIEVQTFGEKDNLTTSQVKEQIAQNPDLSDADRRKMLSHLPSHRAGHQSARGYFSEHDRATIGSPLPL